MGTGEARMWSSVALPRGSEKASLNCWPPQAAPRERRHEGPGEDPDPQAVRDTEDGEAHEHNSHSESSAEL
jgi:hypothetical protein